MTYRRYKNPSPLSPEEKQELLRAYMRFYGELAQSGGMDKLNQKLPRTAVEDFLDRLGGLMTEEARKLSESPGEVRDFLDANPLPSGMAERLPDEFRAFVLLLNALRQWSKAEADACDGYLLGGRWREYCLAAASDHCLITGEPLDGAVELHHPVRDGRPPIPLSKRTHSRIEGQASNSSGGDGEFTEWDRLKELRGTNRSWAMLRRGLADFQAGRPTVTSTDQAGKSFARKVLRELDTTPEHILALLEEHNV